MEELLLTKIPVVATLTAVFFLLTAAQTLHALFLAARKSGRPVSAATVSTMYFFMPRIFTGASTIVRRQRSSQGCSHTSAQAVGKGLSLRIIFTASARRPSSASAM